MPCTVDPLNPATWPVISDEAIAAMVDDAFLRADRYEQIHFPPVLNRAGQCPMEVARIRHPKRYAELVHRFDNPTPEDAARWRQTVNRLFAHTYEKETTQ